MILIPIITLLVVTLSVVATIFKFPSWAEAHSYHMYSILLDSPQREIYRKRVEFWRKRMQGSLKMDRAIQTLFWALIIAVGILVLVAIYPLINWIAYL
jgi:lysylphosphatidylglycerol synthetase-like protein (DUF2156 family)